MILLTSNMPNIEGGWFVVRIDFEEPKTISKKVRTPGLFKRKIEWVAKRNLFVLI